MFTFEHVSGYRVNLTFKILIMYVGKFAFEFKIIHTDQTTFFYFIKKFKKYFDTSAM